MPPRRSALIWPSPMGVNIGIGGSDLEPRMVVQAMHAGGCADGPRVHFVAKMDGHGLDRVLKRLKPET